MSEMLPVRVADPFEDFWREEEVRRQQSADRVARAFEAATRDHIATFGPLKPAPSPEERARMEAEREATARRKADEAMRGLIGLLPLTEDERRFVNRADCDLEGGV